MHGQQNIKIIKYKFETFLCVTVFVAGLEVSTPMYVWPDLV